MAKPSDARPATLRDVAQRAEVSLSTASRALHGGSYASRDAIERVVRAAQELDYRPNAGARALRRSRTLTVGVVFHQLRNQSVLDLLEGIEAGCDERGYSVLVTSAQDSDERYVDLIRRLTEQRVDALLLSNPDTPARSEIDRALAAGTPVVVLSTRGPGLSHVPLVQAPTAQHIDEAVGALGRLGHRSVAFVGSVRGAPSGPRGLIDAAARHGLRFVHERPTDYGEQAAVEALDALLSRDDRPTALFMLFRTLPAVLARLSERRVRVPDDVSLVTINDAASSTAGPGFVAEVRVQVRVTGLEASRMALDWVNGSEPDNPRVVAAASWVPGRSIGPAPGSPRRTLRSVSVESNT